MTTTYNPATSMCSWWTTSSCPVLSWATYCGNATTKVPFSSSAGSKCVWMWHDVVWFLFAVTVVESGPQALEILRRSVPGTFQLILTVNIQLVVTALQ